MTTTQSELEGKIRELFDILKLGRSESWGGEFIHMTRIESVNTDEVAPSIEFRLETKDWMNNLMGAVHGGCATTMVDNISTWAIIGDPKYWKNGETSDEALQTVSREFGVSRNLNLTFVRPIPLNAEIAVIVKVQSNTRRTTHLTFEIIDPKTKKQYVLGTHDKAKPQANL